MSSVDLVPVPAEPDEEPPPWQALSQLVLDSVSSPHSRRAYGFALEEFFAWYRAAARRPFRKALVQEYRAHLEARGFSPSTTNVRLAAIRKLAAEAADNGLLAPDLALPYVTAEERGRIEAARRRAD